MSNNNSNLKTNTTSLQELLNVVNNLPEASNGVELPELTNEGTATDLLEGKELIDSDGNVIIGTISTKTVNDVTANGATITIPSGYYDSDVSKSVTIATRATPIISIDSAGSITASVTQAEGYVTAGTKSSRMPLATQAAKTITPSKSSQTAVEKNVYTTGVVTVNPIPSEYITTTDATATADKIFLNETAYVDGDKVTGSFTIDEELDTQDDLIAQIRTALIGKTAGIDELKLQEKTVVPSNEDVNVTADSGYNALSKVTVKGDSNLTNENIKSGVSIFGISGTYEGSGGSSDTSMENALLDGTLTTYTNESLTTIRGGAFAGYTTLKSVNFPNCTTISCTNISEINTNIGAFQCCSNLTTVSFPVCSYISDYAFANCYSLTTGSFPVCSYIGSNAFANCTSLTSVNFPVCSYIGTYAFYGCTSLTSVSFPVCSYIGSCAFANCPSLTSVNFPACSYIGSNAFDGCRSLTSVSFPVCTRIGSNAFANCSSLTSVNFSVCSYIDYGVFRDCRSLTSVSFPVCRYIGSRAFSNCYNLSQVYLMNSSVCTLHYSNTFNSTPYTGYSRYFAGTPYIYVPSSLVDAYKSASNWSYFSSYIKGFTSNPPSGGSD